MDVTIPVAPLHPLAMDATVPGIVDPRDSSAYAGDDYDTSPVPFTLNVHRATNVL